MSNYFVQELVLYRHFMLIDSPIPFELIANPTNFRKDEHGNILNTDLSEITGRDICSRPAGAWRIDCWTLLPEKYHKQNPVFTMLIKYDKDLLEEGEVVDVRYSDIDIGEGVAGVNGQLVSIPASDFRPIVNSIDEVSEKIGSFSEGETIFSKMDSIIKFFPRTICSGTRQLSEVLRNMSEGETHFILGWFGDLRTALFHGLFSIRVITISDSDSIIRCLVDSVFSKGYVSASAHVVNSVHFDLVYSAIHGFSFSGSIAVEGSTLISFGTLPVTSCCVSILG